MARTMIQPARRRRPLASMLDEMFDDFFAPMQGASGSNSNLPPLNVAETSDAFRLSFELPGVLEKDVSVQVDGEQLIVAAERRFEEEKQDGSEYHRIEHRYGRFARSIALPKDIRADAIDAEFRNGVLTVTLPKAEPSQARKIEIKSS